MSRSSSTGADHSMRDAGTTPPTHPITSHYAFIEASGNALYIANQDDQISSSHEPKIQRRRGFGPSACTDPASPSQSFCHWPTKERACQLGEDSMAGYRGSSPMPIACTVRNVPTGSKPYLDQARCTLALWVCVEMTS